MKIIIAPDSYKESLPALAVARAIEAGFRQVLPEADYRLCPMADGGEGTVQSLVDATQGKIMQVRVTGPLGTPVDGFYGLLGDGKTAVIEMAAASGLDLVPTAKRNPMRTTSYGTGELITAALDQGRTHLIIGIGGSATLDGGAGMLQALGIRLLDRQNQDIGLGGEALSDLARIDTTGLDPRLAQVCLEVACDVDNPLCGPNGAARVFGPQKGATEAMIRQLDANLAHFADCMATQHQCMVRDSPGAGAAGGMGAALMGLLNAHLQPGIEIVIRATGLADIMSDADLVITGEGRIDSQTIHGKTPIGVARCAQQFNVAVIGIAGSLSQDHAIVFQHGLDAVFSVVNHPCDLAEALADGAQNLTLTARNVAALLVLGGQLSALKSH
ncbi:glycerate kinase [Photobacterium sp. 1_MG-2023]|uniref:glycerate kinase n=1 Tax=Photobacterium sp. 1_MG-2023 TaxID=3062646 RepID=UPI0026E36608|nr:glycerate kinase [Photobacterium sp. 1_MG-2023]MDO6706473.1 glycerate kinase [Photobacterium sp. 1_MG-2023]